MYFLHGLGPEWEHVCLWFSEKPYDTIDLCMFCIKVMLYCLFFHQTVSPLHAVADLHVLKGRQALQNVVLSTQIFKKWFNRSKNISFSFVYCIPCPNGLKLFSENHVLFFSKEQLDICCACHTFHSTDILYVQMMTGSLKYEHKCVYDLCI